MFATISGLAMSIWIFIGRSLNEPGIEWTRPLTATTDRCDLATGIKIDIFCFLGVFVCDFDF